MVYTCAMITISKLSASMMATADVIEDEHHACQGLGWPTKYMQRLADYL